MIPIYEVIGSVGMYVYFHERTDRSTSGNELEKKAASGDLKMKNDIMRPGAAVDITAKAYDRYRRF